MSRKVVPLIYAFAICAFSKKIVIDVVLSNKVVVF